MPTTAADRARRRGAGSFYTPPAVADYLARRVLDRAWTPAVADGSEALRVLDPACGDGVFLRCALEDISRRRARSAPLSPRHALPAEILQAHLFGVDRDAAAVAAARTALADKVRELAGEPSAVDSPGLLEVLQRNIRQGDALLDPAIWETQSCPTGAGSDPLRPNKPFDVVLANPPYVNIRRLTQTLGPAAKRLLTERFVCASRCYDLYVLFIELAFDLLREGGVCGLVVPNKIGSADYADPCRRLLLERTEILEIVNTADVSLFPGADVYPYLMLWRKRAAPRSHRVRVKHLRSATELAEPTGGEAVEEVPQARWRADAGFELHGTLDVERRVPTEPLGECAHVESGTTGFLAGRLADRLLELREAETRGWRPEQLFEFIVSGNIDRYHIRTGAARFMKRRYERPVLPRDAAILSAAKRRLFERNKIVVAGMTKRLESAWDPGGRALGVQVYAVIPREAPVPYLLALLNSKLLSYLFRVRFSAKQLGGGYLSINKGQLNRLPIRRIRAEHAGDRRLLRELLERAEVLRTLPARIGGCGESGKPEGGCLRRAAECAVDTIVYALYRLNAAEIRQVEAHFPPPRSTD